MKLMPELSPYLTNIINLDTFLAKLYNVPPK